MENDIVMLQEYLIHLLTRVAGQMFGAYLPDKTLLDLTGVPKKQVTLESCHNPEIRIGHPDAVR